MNGHKFLTHEELKVKAPSVFAEKPDEKVSNRYRFISTIEVVKALEKENWFPTFATQTKARTAEQKMVTKHLLRLRNPDLPSISSNKQAVPEIALYNAHDLTSKYKFFLGIINFICMNGLICASETFGSISVKHGKNIVVEAVEASYKLTENIPKIAEKVNEFEHIILDEAEQVAFAETALQLKYDPEKEIYAPIKPEQLLMARRTEDNKPDLWNTYNRVQENLLKGGLKGRSEKGKRTTTRKVTNLSKDQELNRYLWALTEKMAELKTA